MAQFFPCGGSGIDAAHADHRNLPRLLADAEGAGFRQMIAVIGDSENIGSIGVHTSLGFKQVGLLRASGLKFGRWVDTVYMQRALGRGDVDVPG